jgi:hypothetical protein
MPVETVQPQQAVHIHRNKLPKGLSFPVKSSVLCAPLHDISQQVEVTIYFSRTGHNFHVIFSPPGEIRPIETLQVFVGVVPSASAALARENAEVSIIPQFIKWITRLLAEPSNSTIRRNHQHFSREYLSSTAVIPAQAGTP